MNFKQYILITERVTADPDMWYRKPGQITWSWDSGRLFWIDPKSMYFMYNNRKYKLLDELFYKSTVELELIKSGIYTHGNLNRAIILAGFTLPNVDQYIRGRVSPNRKDIGVWMHPSFGKEWEYNYNKAVDAVYKYIIK